MIGISTFSELLQVHNVVGADPIPEDESVGQVMIIIPNNTITDMEFVQKFTPPDFKVRNFTPRFSPNMNSFSKKKHKKLMKMEKFTPLATNFTLPPGLMGWTNFTSVQKPTILPRGKD